MPLAGQQAEPHHPEQKAALWSRPDVLSITRFGSRGWHARAGSSGRVTNSESQGEHGEQIHSAGMLPAAGERACGVCRREVPSR